MSSDSMIDSAYEVAGKEASEEEVAEKEASGEEVTGKEASVEEVSAEMQQSSCEKPQIHIRPATIEDAPALLEIYSYYVKNTAITFEITPPDLEEFQRRMIDIQKKFPYLLAECDGEILGYSYAHPYHERAAFRFDVETTIYLDKKARGRGIGKRLYQALETSLKKQGVVHLYALIAEPETEDEYLTLASSHFHRHMGYSLAGCLKNSGYKFCRWYHMATYEKQINPILDKMPEVTFYEK